MGGGHVWTLLGCLSFCLFFLGDWNDWKWSLPGLRCCFPIGILLLTVATAHLAEPGKTFLPIGIKAVFYLLGAGFLGLLIYTLFFALPAKEAYAQQGDRRQTLTNGIYALCRHPGVLWFTGLYLCLWAVGVPLSAVLLYCGLDLLLVVFEDFFVFPARLAGYDAYRQTTPFLLPNRGSLRACLK